MFKEFQKKHRDLFRLIVAGCLALLIAGYCWYLEQTHLIVFKCFYTSAALLLFGDVDESNLISYSRNPKKFNAPFWRMHFYHVLFACMAAYIILWTGDETSNLVFVIVFFIVMAISLMLSPSYPKLDEVDEIIDLYDLENPITKTPLGQYMYRFWPLALGMVFIMVLMSGVNKYNLFMLTIWFSLMAKYPRKSDGSIRGAIFNNSSRMSGALLLCAGLHFG